MDGAGIRSGPMIYPACLGLSLCQLLPRIAVPSHMALGKPADGQRRIRSERVIGMACLVSPQARAACVGWAVSLINSKCPLPCPHILSHLFSRQCPPCADVACFVRLSDQSVRDTASCLVYFWITGVVLMLGIWRTHRFRNLSWK